MTVGHRLISDSGGAVGVVAALSLVGLIGAAGLAVDLTRGYEQRILNQRVADMAALSAALAYKASGGSAAILDPTAVDIVTAHGITNATVRAELVTDMPTAGAKAVKVTLSSPIRTSLSRIIGAAANYPVGVTAYASLSANGGVPGCIIGLATSGNAIETQGGATIEATGCAVQGVGTVANNGTAIRAKEIVSGSADVSNNYGTLAADMIRYGGSFNNQSWNTNIPAADKRVKQATNVVDPLAGNLDLTAARDLLGTFRAPRTIGNPDTPNCNSVTWTFGSSPSAAAAVFRQGNSSNFTVPGNTYCVGRITMQDGVSVKFTGQTTLTVSNGVSIGGGAKVDFGNGTFRINGGFAGGSYDGITFGNVDLHIGSGSVSFSGPNRIGDGSVAINAPIALNGGTTLSMGNGDHAFAGISIGGGSWMTLGNGNLDNAGAITIGGNSNMVSGVGEYRLANPGGDAINLGGSARLFMGDGLFSTNGNIVTAGDSRLVIGKTANHLINGNLSIAGAVLFGAGRYTVKGGFNNGTGGTTWPYTWSVTGQTWGNTLEGQSVSGYDMAGINVSFIMGGTVNLAGGARTKLIAPAATTSGGAIADILIDSLTDAATNWGAGAQNVFAGIVHLPKSAVTMSGGNNTLSNGQCFSLIAFRILASGGANAGTACPTIGGGGSSGGDQVTLIG